MKKTHALQLCGAALLALVGGLFFSYVAISFSGREGGKQARLQKSEVALRGVSTLRLSPANLLNLVLSLPNRANSSVLIYPGEK